MNEEQRRQILEIIRQTIDEVVYDEIKQMPSKLEAKQNEMKRTKSQLEQDVEEAIFGKKEDEYTNKLKLHESFENDKPRISVSELESFEKEFKSHFTGNEITFDKQNGFGKSGEIVDFPQNNGEKDAVTSGKITVGKDKIQFSMSLLNGLKIKSSLENGQLKDFQIDKQNKDIFGKLLNLYDTIFKQKFNDILNKEPEQEETGEAQEVPTAAPVSAQSTSPEAAMATPPAPQS